MQVFTPEFDEEIGDFEQVNIGAISLNKVEEQGFTSDNCDPYDMIEIVEVMDSDDYVDSTTVQIMLDKGWL